MTQPLKQSELSRPARRLTYHRIRRRVLKWRTLANARRSMPSILNVLSDGEHGSGARGWKLHWMTWAGSSALDTAALPIGTRVVAGVGPEEGPALVIKIPSAWADIRQLRRGHDAIARIRANPDIGDWSELVSHGVSERTNDGQLFFVEAVVPGVNAQELLVSIPAVDLLCRAAQSIRGLHDATSVPVVVDADAFARWVSEPLRRVRHVLAAAHGTGPWEHALQSLEGALQDALLGRILLAGWVHGDFWLGNVLMPPRGERVTGVIDWDRARPAEAVAHDVVHLLLVHRMFAAPTQRFFGETVHSFLTGQQWSVEELQVLSRAELPFSPRDTAGQNALVLLCWIRRMLMDMEATDSPPSKLWITRNIDVVLSHFQP